MIVALSKRFSTRQWSARGGCLSRMSCVFPLSSRSRDCLIQSKKGSVSYVLLSASSYFPSDTKGRPKYSFLLVKQVFKQFILSHTSLHTRTAGQSSSLHTRNNFILTAGRSCTITNYTFRLFELQSTSSGLLDGLAKS
ncbi:unnamed protein product [Cercospora beticola]|nr:unnamed protein product [Cercospora beticola]